MDRWKDFAWVFFISMLPIVELRVAIPLGIGMGLDLLPTYVVAILGNMLPVPFILLLAKAVLLWCIKLPKVGGLFEWIHRKGLKAGDKLSEETGFYQYIALYTFVAIPLPGTGAWTGSLGATLLGMKFWPAVLAVMAGVLTAGVIMGAASMGVSGLFGLFA